MKVFISWSGTKSHAAALAFKKWLPSVIQAIDDPWVSSEDIEVGGNWSASIGGELETAKFGIVCVTTENQGSQWLNFEAGAISKLIGNAAPVLIDFDKPTDLTGPMSQLQVTMPTEEKIFKLMRDINLRLADAGDKPLPNDVLARSFTANWPTLRDQLNEIKALPSTHTPPRSADDKIDEMLSILRQVERASKPDSLGAAQTKLPPYDLSGVSPGRPTSAFKPSSSVTVRLSPGAEEKLAAISDSTGQTRSEMVRSAIERYIVNGLAQATDRYAEALESEIRANGEEAS